MLVKSATLVVSLASLALGAVVPSSYAVHEKRDAASSKWIRRGKVPSNQKLPVRIGLKQANLDKAEDFLMDVSDPASPNYGKHWTSEQVIESFAPDQKTVGAVKKWLVDSGISSERITHSDNKGWLAFDATTKEVEGLVHAEYHVYEHTTTGHVARAADVYHLPKDIQDHVDYMTPGVKLLSGTKKGEEKRRVNSRGLNHGSFKFNTANIFPWHSEDLSTCDTTITPACIRALYGVPKPFGRPRPDNSLGIFEGGDFYTQKDLDLFFANFTPSIPQGTHPVPAFIDGADAPTTNLSDAGGESLLDFELAYPLIYPQTITLYQTDDLYYATSPDSPDGGFNTFLDALDGSYCTYSVFNETGNDPNLDPVYPDPNAGGYKGKLQCGVYKPTNVISVSYGGQEADLPAYYQERQCNEFLKLGLQGHSIFFASGDDGVQGPKGDDSPTGCLGEKENIFSPAWPNNCPWLTNVGATKVYPGRSVFEPESAVVDPPGHPYRDAFSSGGGFSNIYSQPKYQKAAVASFFKHHNPPYPSYPGPGNASFGANGGLYNRGGRGYPDVAANGDNIGVYAGGKFGHSGGTSASTPIFASIINRINEIRLDLGKRPIGFINPALYANPWLLNDIKNGSNPGCSTEGFSAVTGWDPVTGLGTPNFPKLSAYFVTLP